MRIQDVAILVVDDVNAMRTQIQELLQKVGFDLIFLASNGVEAKVVLENESEIKLIMADWHMEPVNGLELLEFVRTDKRFSKIAYVMVTAESIKENVIKAIGSGVDDYLVKPLT